MSVVLEIWNRLLFQVNGSLPSQFFLLISSFELSFASKIGKFDLIKSLSIFVTELVTWGYDPSISLTRRYLFVSYYFYPLGRIIWPLRSVIESSRDVSTWFLSRFRLITDPLPILGYAPSISQTESLSFRSRSIEFDLSSHLPFIPEFY